MTTTSNDHLLVEDEDVSKELWLKEKGNARGFQTAWSNKFLHKEPSTKLQRQRMKTATRPRLVDNKQDMRISEPNAYSIGRTKEGWVVMEYDITGNHATLIKCSKPELKQFAVARLKNRIMEDINSG